MVFSFANSWLYEMKGTDRSRYEEKEGWSSRYEGHLSESDIDEDAVTDSDEFLTSGSYISPLSELHPRTTTENSSTFEILIYKFQEILGHMHLLTQASEHLDLKSWTFLN